MKSKSHLNESYKLSGVDIDYSLYLKIIEDYFLVVRGAILDSQDYKIPCGLGIISVKTIKRNFSKKQIDWKSSYELKEEIEKSGRKPRERGSAVGENWIVYFTDSFYNRIHWNKKKAAWTKNLIKYKFYPAWHFRRMLSKALKEDEFKSLLT